MTICLFQTFIRRSHSKFCINITRKIIDIVIMFFFFIYCLQSFYHITIDYIALNLSIISQNFFLIKITRFNICLKEFNYLQLVEFQYRQHNLKIIKYFSARFINLNQFKSLLLPQMDLLLAKFY